MHTSITIYAAIMTLSSQLRINRTNILAVGANLRGWADTQVELIHCCLQSEFGWRDLKQTM